MRVTRSIIPNLFTLMNLYMGFTAMVFISQQLYMKAAMFILVAGIFDMLDGLVARLTRSTSEFGVELDSLCDAVSFGVAPSYMLYSIYFHQFGDIGILFSSFPALAGVVRLARFNVQLNSFEDKKYFTGLAIPSNAIFIISYLLFYHTNHYLTETGFFGLCKWQDIAVFFVTLSSSAAMVSRIKFDNIPKPTKKKIKQNPVVFSVFIIGLVGSIVSKGYFIFPFMLFYILASSIRHFFWWIKQIIEHEGDFDEGNDPEEIPYDID